MSVPMFAGAGEMILNAAQQARLLERLGFTTKGGNMEMPGTPVHRVDYQSKDGKVPALVLDALDDTKLTLLVIDTFNSGNVSVETAVPRGTGGHTWEVH